MKGSMVGMKGEYGGHEGGGGGGEYGGHEGGIRWALILSSTLARCDWMV